jgi:hypothetical protein
MESPKRAAIQKQVIVSLLCLLVFIHTNVKVDIHSRDS